MDGRHGPGVSDQQIGMLAVSLSTLATSLALFGSSASVERELDRLRKAIVELLHRLTICAYQQDDRGVWHAVNRQDLSDHELRIRDLLQISLHWVVSCLSKKGRSTEAAEEFKKLGSFSRELAGESCNDLPPNIGTIADDLRALADDVRLLGPKASGIDIRAGYISWALAVIYSDLTCDVEVIANGHTKSRLKVSPTMSELTSKGVVEAAMRLLDSIRNTPQADCARRLRSFADRLDKCPEVARYRNNGPLQCDINSDPRGDSGPPEYSTRGTKMTNDDSPNAKAWKLFDRDRMREQYTELERQEEEKLLKRRYYELSEWIEQMKEICSRSGKPLRQALQEALNDKRTFTNTPQRFRPQDGESYMRSTTSQERVREPDYGTLLQRVRTGPDRLRFFIMLCPHARDAFMRGELPPYPWHSPAVIAATTAQIVERKADGQASQSETPPCDGTQAGAIHGVTEATTAEPVIENKTSQGKHDVFLCYNSKDRAVVEAIAKQLTAKGVHSWLDAWAVPPGQSWVKALDDAIPNIGSAGVFIGPSGIGPWEQQEIEAFLTEFVSKGTRVIPVLLPGVKKKPNLPVFLKTKAWVDMSSWHDKNGDALYRLVCGIFDRSPGGSAKVQFTKRDVNTWRIECRQKS
jgi:hypothetical protein